MELFETAWSVKGKIYVREYDDVLKKSVKRLTEHQSEYYVEDTLGQYTSFLNTDVKLRRVQGSAYNIPNAYGVKDGKYVAIRDDFVLKNKQYNKKPRIWYLDIETSVGTVSKGFPKPELALEPIVLIQFFDSIENKGYVLGLEEWVYRNDYNYDFELEYIKCNSEEELLNTFLKLFKDLDPFIIYAWNGEFFDFPYIFNRLKKFGLSNKLSNYGTAKLKQKVLDNKQIINDIVTDGHLFLDLMALYKKFVFDTVPSYSLDFIGEKETGLKKVNHDNYVKFDDFRIGKYVILGNETPEIQETKIFKCAKMLENPNVPPEKREKLKQYIKQKSHSDFINYGVIDFVILKDIDKAQNLTDLVLTMSEDMGCLQEDILGTLKAWDCSITNTIFKDNLIAPPHAKKTNPYVVGGFVRRPIKGKHKWILSSDVASMYPLLSMAAFNMSPETFIPFEDRPQELKDITTKFFKSQNEDDILDITDEEFKYINEVCSKYNVSCGINGAMFTKEKQGVIPKLVQHIYNKRKSIKKEMWNEVQTILDLESQTLQELDKIHFHNEKKKVFNTQQMAAKIRMNALYGAFASANFSMYNEIIAGAITGNGRYFIKLLANKVEEDLQSMIKSSKPFLIAGDTDSCVGSTLLNTNQGIISIEDFYNMSSGKVEIRGENNYVKHLNGKIKSKSFNVITQAVEDKPINYIMKHKVKKELFKITYKNKEVIITKDHSIIIKRGNQFLSVTPLEILPNDSIIVL